MEQSRIFIAIVLSFIVFFVWEAMFGKQPMQPPAPVETAAPQAQPVEVAPAKPAAVEHAAVAEASAEAPAAKAEAVGGPADRNPRKIVVENSKFRIVIDEIGGSVRSVALKQYRKTVQKDSPAFELVGEDLPGGTIGVGLEGEDAGRYDRGFFAADVESDRVDVGEKPQTLEMVYRGEDGLILAKRFTFHPESYLIDLDVTVRNSGAQTIHSRLYVRLCQRHVQKKGSSYGFEGPSALIGNRLEQIKIDDIEDKSRYEGNIGWIALQDRYFLSAVVPAAPVETELRLGQAEGGILKSSYLQPDQALAPGEARTSSYKVFFGPKRTEVLKPYGLELERSVHFGMFDFIAKPCLWFMNWIYGIIPNYGIAIILLTILTKVILWPLGTKSYKSMNEMKRMQPLMNEIREKYKNDKKKMNEEMMGLYRTYKVNPLGGCLPMLVQLPVFFALYRMLYEAIELRHAPFFGWINDLSAPDRLFSFGVSIPLMEPPYGIPVLTIIMGATMFLQQKMTPAPGDPTQAKMMTFMPIIFTFIFINFSSGLVLYWLVNNVTSIGQQYYISKKYA